MFFYFFDLYLFFCIFFFFQAEDGIRDPLVTGVQTCALPISLRHSWRHSPAPLHGPPARSGAFTKRSRASSVRCSGPTGRAPRRAGSSSCTPTSIPARQSSTRRWKASLSSSAPPASPTPRRRSRSLVRSAPDTFGTGGSHGPAGSHRRLNAPTAQGDGRDVGRVSHHPQAARFREQAEGCLPASPLSAALLSAMADDLDAGGVTAKAVAGHEGDRPGTVLPLRMLAALHRLVLEGRAPALSSFYPSVGGAALAGAAWPAAAAAMREHLADMHLLVDQTVQTNEPGRASLLFGGLLVVAERTGLPIRL